MNADFYGDTVRGEKTKVYENRYALPLGYAYDAALSIDDYLAMPVEQKLQALGLGLRATEE